MSEQTYRVVAVNLISAAREVLTTGKTKANAEALADMAVMRQGVEHRIFVVEPE